MPLVTIRTALRPTEDPEKVRTAIRNIFPESEITAEEGEIVAKTGSLDRFKTLNPQPAIHSTPSGTSCSTEWRPVPHPSR